MACRRDYWTKCNKRKKIHANQIRNERKKKQKNIMNERMKIQKWKTEKVGKLILAVNFVRRVLLAMVH